MTKLNPKPSIVHTKQAIIESMKCKELANPIGLSLDEIDTSYSMGMV